MRLVVESTLSSLLNIILLMLLKDRKNYENCYLVVTNIFNLTLINFINLIEQNF